MNRVKRTLLVNGVTGRVSAKNYIISVGPDWDIHRDVVVFIVTYHGVKYDN